MAGRVQAKGRLHRGTGEGTKYADMLESRKGGENSRHLLLG